MLLLDQDACGAGVPEDSQDVAFFDVAEFFTDENCGYAELLCGFECLLI